MHVCVTGGCGYKGSRLVPKLLELGYEVTVWDTAWFGNFLPQHPRLHFTQCDIRNYDELSLDGFQAVVHLASVANDPCSDLNPKLSWEISALSTMKIAEKAVSAGVESFIYASSGSVYGIKEEEQVTENLQLVPLSDYNKTKMVAERVLMSFASDFSLKIVRPATVCGYSPRMRFDVAVNLLTIQALETGCMTVLGGSQVRPNIHIDDMVDLYAFLLRNPDIEGTFNAGFENISILDLAQRISEKTGAEIKIEESNDPRSYRLNSDKIISKGFAPKRSVSQAIDGLIRLHRSGDIVNEDRFHNLKWMMKHSFE